MNLDKLKLKPDQLTDFDFTECTAISASVLAGNILGVPMNPDFTYAATLYLSGVAPTEDGADPRAAMYSTVAFGTLPQTDETFTAATIGELYAANFANYTAQEKLDALKNVMNAVSPVPLDWNDICAKLNAGFPISLPMRWYWGSNPPTVLTMPKTGQPFTNHNVVIWDSADPRGLTIQPWLGTQGDNGYFYLPQPVFDYSAFAAYTYYPNGSRLLSLISASIVFFPKLVISWSNLGL